ncbi:sodium/hydrogen antiporter [Pneumocystis carinii B80]|uniref:Sodium/hydrogen antiporter n=1 Tax=Pneumocystis carinii (strain B80) TaxID=1408658 RepID=A0A0W4ZHY5_PNEC8|nr:sodium/hydrogen antiporter [Pneumocystis carinii B80]KTW27986.1 sodium/hydrogen antiporter [Pneumocystis carinii B80]
MVWNQVGISKLHIAYIILGCSASLFMLVSLFIKQRLYIGEAMVATIVGIVFGPCFINIFDPGSWGNIDYNTLELSRIVLIVQVFAVGVELPKGYILKHWKSLVMLLCPVMIFGWIITSVIVYLLVPNLVFIEALILGACVTATDPVLASSIVGESEFSKKIPEHIRNILSCESGCNDGFALPFLFIGLQLLADSFRLKTIGKFFLIKILYEVVFGCILGLIIGFFGRKVVKFSEKYNLIDRESFLAFYFVLSLFCAGIGTLVGIDDLLVSFSAGAAFSWDGWFSKKTEESHVSSVIDLLLNFAFFVYWGAMIPWKQYNMPELGITPWRLLIVAICVLLFRRIPVILTLKPLIPDIHTWREAFFCGHFGPMGVGAIFVSVLARIELETKIGKPSEKVLANSIISYHKLILMIWPITSFLVLSSIIVHGSSVAIFVLGKHLNSFSFTPTHHDNECLNWINRFSKREIIRPVIFRRNSEKYNTCIKRKLNRERCTSDPVKFFPVDNLSELENGDIFHMND